jgi:hypothetical protein
LTRHQERRTQTKGKMELPTGYPEKCGALGAYIDLISYEVNRLNETDNEFTRQYAIERLTDLVKTAKEIANEKV